MNAIVSTALFKSFVYYLMTWKNTHKPHAVAIVHLLSSRFYSLYILYSAYIYIYIEREREREREVFNIDIM